MNLDTIYNEDCLEGMKNIPDGSVDLILTDPPYGITACKWDTVIPFEPLWEQYKRVIKEHGAIVLFCAQPFTSNLIMSNKKGFKHHWVWLKNRGTGFQVAKYRPMMKTEDIVAFTKRGEKINYHPQMIKLDKPYKGTGAKSTNGTNPLAHFNKMEKVYTEKYPTNVLEFDKVSRPLHPTQKPVVLLEYLIKTYTNEGETVLDPFMGSGSTAVACVNTGRNYIGFETDFDYCKIASQRILKARFEKWKEENKSLNI